MDSNSIPKLPDDGRIGKAVTYHLVHQIADGFSEASDLTIKAMAPGLFRQRSWRWFGAGGKTRAGVVPGKSVARLWDPA